MNLQLIQTFTAVRADPAVVHHALQQYQDEYSSAPDRATYYYSMRERYNRALPAPDPATFIFLNRTCWNGLYRVNQKGEFNVPYGRPKSTDVIPSLAELESAGAALARAKLRATAWENTIASARRGDFIFLDPPYYSDIKRDDTKYGSRQFSLRHHERLARRLRQLADRGVEFMLTNSAEETMVDLYSSHGLTVDVVGMPRVISTKVKERVPTRELVVTPGDRQASSHDAHRRVQTLMRHAFIDGGVEKREPEGSVLPSAPVDERV